MELLREFATPQAAKIFDYINNKIIILN